MILPGPVDHVVAEEDWHPQEGPASSDNSVLLTDLEPLGPVHLVLAQHLRHALRRHSYRGQRLRRGRGGGFSFCCRGASRCPIGTHPVIVIVVVFAAVVTSITIISIIAASPTLARTEPRRRTSGRRHGTECIGGRCRPEGGPDIGRGGPRVGHRGGQRAEAVVTIAVRRRRRGRVPIHHDYFLTTRLCRK